MVLMISGHVSLTIASFKLHDRVFPKPSLTCAEYLYNSSVRWLHSLPLRNIRCFLAAYIYTLQTKPLLQMRITSRKCPTVTTIVGCPCVQTETEVIGKRCL